jgi:hypothetical protein
LPSGKDTHLLNNIEHFFFPSRAKDSVKHFHVEYTGYSFKFGFNEYSSLKDFVKHFANQPLIGSETGKLS